MKSSAIKKNRMNIFIVFYICCIGLLIGGCTDSQKSYQIVQKKYPDCNIIQSPTNKYSFLVKCDDVIRYVSCMNVSNDDISSDIIIFKLDK